MSSEICRMICLPYALQSSSATFQQYYVYSSVFRAKIFESMDRPNQSSSAIFAVITALYTRTQNQMAHRFVSSVALAVANFCAVEFENQCKRFKTSPTARRALSLRRPVLTSSNTGLPWGSSRPRPSLQNRFPVPQLWCNRQAPLLPSKELV